MHLLTDVKRIGKAMITYLHILAHGLKPQMHILVNVNLKEPSMGFSLNSHTLSHLSFILLDQENF